MDKLIFGCVFIVCWVSVSAIDHNNISFTPSQSALLGKTGADSFACEWCSCISNETIPSKELSEGCASQLNDALTKDGSQPVAVDDEYWISHIKCSSTKSSATECNFIGLSDHVHTPKQQAEAETSDHLMWTIPVITLVLIAMAVGGYMLHRHTEKKGYNQYIVDGSDKQEIEA